MYVFKCRLSLFRLCDSDFGITPVDDVTNGITWTVFCFHIAHISFVSSWYLFCLSVIVLARLCVFGTAMSIKKKRCSLFSYWWLLYQVGWKVLFIIIIIIIIIIIGWDTAVQAGRSRVWFPKVSSEFFIGIILPAALWPLGWLSL
jgi:hypothetical protein